MDWDVISGPWHFSMNCSSWSLCSCRQASDGAPKAILYRFLAEVPFSDVHSVTKRPLPSPTEKANLELCLQIKAIPAVQQGG